MKRGQLLRRLAAVEPVGDLLLDEFPNALAAYSLRKLRSDYTGAAIRVRRDSDDAEQDIGFASNGFINITELNNFLGIDEGFITTWYDQSGATTYDISNPLHLGQPKIIQNANGKYGIQFYNRDNFIRLYNDVGSKIADSIYTFTHAKSEQISANSLRQDTLFRHTAFLRRDFDGSDNMRIFRGNFADSPETFDNQELFTAYFDLNNGGSLWLNGVNEILEENVSTQEINIINLSHFSDDDNDRFHFEGWYYEHVIYDTEPDRLGIENNINNYYDVF